MRVESKRAFHLLRNHEHLTAMHDEDPATAGAGARFCQNPLYNDPYAGTSSANFDPYAVIGNNKGPGTVRNPLYDACSAEDGVYTKNASNPVYESGQPDMDEEDQQPVYDQIINSMTWPETDGLSARRNSSVQLWRDAASEFDEHM